MKKTFPLILPCLLLAACGGASSSLSRIVYSSSDSASSPASSSSSTSASSSEPGSSESLISSAIESSEQSSSEESFVPPTVEDFVPRYLQKIGQYKSYQAITKGSTKAKVLFIETTQSIDVTLIKGEYSYLKNESHSDLVNTVHQAYFHGQKVAYRDNDAGYIASDLNTYLDAYGVYPFDPAIEGYLCGKGCIKSVEKLEASEGYAFKVSFEPEKSTNNVRIQMKAFGQLDDYPVFSAIDITVYTKNDLTPDHLEVSADYNAKKIVDTSCHQEYRVDFSRFNEEIAVPDLETIKATYDI